MRNKDRAISVAQLEQVLRATQGSTDSRVAQQLSKMKLSERLDGATLLRLQQQLSGDEARRALLELADMSAEPSGIPAPSVDDQKLWLTRAVNYVANTFSALPNFFASRNVAHFADTPPTQNGSVFIPYQPMRFVGESTATVLYRDRKEVLDEKATSGNPGDLSIGLITSGEFGPLLGTVLQDAARGSLRWSHWGQGVSGPIAVYRYAVTEEKSHYQVKFCCVPEDGTMKLYRRVSAYHGEIAIDPATGSILRLTLQADLKQTYPMERADILIEYGAVEIGGKSYICPLRSVAIARASVRPDAEAPEHPHFRGMLSEESHENSLPVQTLLNDISFDQYHLFRANSRILSSNESKPGEN